jgi:hypothetical protein
VLRYLNFEVLFLQEKPNKLLEVMSIQSQDKLIKATIIFLCIQIPVKVRAIDPLRFSTLIREILRQVQIVCRIAISLCSEKA